MCAVFKQNVKKFNAIAHTKNFANAPKAINDTNGLVMAIGKTKKNLLVQCVKIQLN